MRLILGKPLFMRTYRFQGELMNFDPRKGGIGNFARGIPHQGVCKIFTFSKSKIQVHPADALIPIRPFIYKDIDRYRGKKGSSPKVHPKFTNDRLKFTDFGSKFTTEVGKG